jgi:hypothetical protein
MMADEPGGVVLVCKAIGLSWVTTSRILALGADRSGRAESDADHAQAEFDKLTKPTAERIMRFWRVRQTVS